MKRNIMFSVVILSLLFLLFGCGTADNENNVNNNNNENEVTEENNVNDDNETANEEEQEDPPLVATTVALVEILDALEIDLVGIPTSYKELPERYDDAKEVGMAAEPDMEIIKSLQPEDVLSVTTLDHEYDLQPVFDQADVPVTFYDMESVEGMYNTILELGETYGREEQAQAIIDDFEERTEAIEATIEDKESPKVLILLGVPGSYLIATEDSYLGDLVRRAGGENVFKEQDGLEYIAANTEHLQQAEPDIILRAAHGMPDAVVEMFDKEFAENDIWKHFKAVQDDRVYDLEETLFGTTANLAVPEALEELLDMLYED